MIYEVRITDPLDWLEADSLHDPWRESAKHPKYLEDFAYELRVPNINGNVVSFSQGLNVIIGPNGSGKSSLINLLAKITGCSREFHSTFYRDDFLRNAQGGLYSCCKVKADYGISTFCLHVPDALTELHQRLSLEIGLNAIRTKEKSDGQRTMLSIESLLNIFNTDGTDVTNNRPRNLKDFKLHVTEPLEMENAKFPNSVWALINDYYAKNDNQQKTAEGMALLRPPVTFLMDAPDANLDVPNQKLLYDFLLKAIKCPNRYQFIVTLNSPLLIRSLAMIEGVNWIELHKGYQALAVQGNAFVPRSQRKDEDKQSEPKQEPETKK